MKDNKETRFISKKTKKTLLFVVNIILIVALLAISTYAWFFRNLADKVDTLEIQFTAGLSLKVSISEEEADRDTDYDYKKTITNFDSAALSKELTGDGIPSHFVYPKLAQSNNGLYSPDINETNWTTSGGFVNGSDYICKRLRFRSTIPVDIYLTNGSYVKSKSEINGKGLVSTNQSDLDTERLSLVQIGSSYFSKDCVVGATRVAFLNKDKNKTNLLWIPRPDIFNNTTSISGPETAGSDKDYFKSLSASSATNSNPTKVPNPGEHWFYQKVNEKWQKVTYTDNAMPTMTAGTYELPSTDASRVADADKLKKSWVGTTKSVDDSGYYKAEIYVCIWIDGTDAEARKDFVGGKFGANFQFVGIATTNKK